MRVRLILCMPRHRNDSYQSTRAVGRSGVPTETLTLHGRLFGESIGPREPVRGPQLVLSPDALKSPVDIARQARMFQLVETWIQDVSLIVPPNFGLQSGVGVGSTSLPPSPIQVDRGERGPLASPRKSRPFHLIIGHFTDVGTMTLYFSICNTSCRSQMITELS